MPLCSICRENKPERQFYRDKRRGLRYARCVGCHLVATAAWYERNRERVRVRARKWRKKHAVRRREYTRKWRSVHPPTAAQLAKKHRKDRHWWASNAKKINAVRRKHRRLFPHVYKNHALRRTFGISLEDYKRRLEGQGGLCAICRGLPAGRRRYLDVDHDHKTNLIRGLLCSSCNGGIGLLKDSRELLREAIAYLDRAEAAANAAVKPGFRANSNRSGRRRRAIGPTGPTAWRR